MPMVTHKYHMDVILRNVVKTCEDKWKLRPVCILACQGAADEHWQVWHPVKWAKGENSPHYTIDTEGECFQHVFD